MRLLGCFLIAIGAFGFGLIFGMEQMRNHFRHEMRVLQMKCRLDGAA